MSVIVDGQDLTLLSDEDLYLLLEKHGITIGPIVPSTRRVYIRKLALKMGMTMPYINYNGDVDLDEESSNLPAAPSSPPSHPIQQEVRQPTITPSTPAASSTSTSHPIHHEVRQRVGSSVPEFDPSRHTPSPRRSIRTVTTSTVTTTTEKRVPEDEVDSKQSSSSILRVLVKMCLLLVIIVVLIVVYDNYYNENSGIKSDKLLEQVMDAVKEFQSSDSASKSQHAKVPPVKD